MLNIKTGTQKRAVKVVITGTEGIGKSTLASHAPDALFIDTEGGTDQIDTRRVSGIKTWTELNAVIDEVIATPSCCKTLVLDTADWAEGMCIRHICSKFKVNGIETLGYGKGYTYLYEEFGTLLEKLNKLIPLGISVIIIAHAKMRKQELPEEQGAFDRWELKLSRQVAPLVKEWADAVLFCNYKTMVIANDSGAKKAVGGERVIYTTHHPCWDAKNRFGLKDELPLDFSSIASIFPEKKTQNTVETPKFEVKPPTLRELLDSEGIEDSELQTIVAKKGKYPIDTPISQYSDDFVQGWIIPNFTKIKALIAKEK